MENNAKPFYGISEIADILDQSTDTIRCWVRDGRLPAYKIGKRIIIRWSDVERVLEGSQVVPQSEVA